MSKKQKINEVEHWIYFIKKWEQEESSPIPEQAILSLEVALGKFIYEYNCSKKSKKS